MNKLLCTTGANHDKVHKSEVDYPPGTTGRGLYERILLTVFLFGAAYTFYHKISN